MRVAENGTIENCYFYNNDYAGIFLNGWCENFTIFNNTFSNNWRGIELEENSHNNSIIENKFINNNLPG